MAVSRTDICNLALGLLDEDPIQDLDSQDEPKAAVLRIHFPNSFDSGLLAHPWNSCTGREKLTQDADAPLFGFAYQFTLPADCLTVRKVVNPDCGKEIDRWSVEANRKLLCDFESPGIIYTARVIQIPRLPAYVIEVISYHLALRTARAITGSDTKGQALREELQRTVLPDAQHRDAMEGHSGENNSAGSMIARAGITRARFKSGPLSR